MINYTISSFGVSIGTGIALESLFKPTTERYDDTRVIPVNVDLNKYKVVYFNLYTIVRNIISAIESKFDKNNALKYPDVMDAAMEEVNTISALFTDYKCKPILFVPDYDKVYKGANIDKGSITDSNDYLQQVYVKHFVKNKVYDVTMDVIVGTYKLRPSVSNVIILTHAPVDLLNISKIPKLVMLESHTGKIKDSLQWYTKYHKIGKAPMEVFPFLEELVMFLGENVIVKTHSLVKRRTLHAIATEKHWTPHTSRAKVLSDMKKNKEFNTMLKNYKLLY